MVVAQIVGTDFTFSSHRISPPELYPRVAVEAPYPSGVLQSAAMRAFLHDFGRWLWLVISGWRQYAEAGSTALVWVLIEKARERPLSWHVLELPAGVFLLFAFFNVWRDEMKKHGETRSRELELKEDLRVIEERRQAKAIPDRWVELTRERLHLQDEVAQKEAEYTQNVFLNSTFRSSIGRIMTREPDRSALIRGEIERRKKRIREIDEFLSQ